MQITRTHLIGTLAATSLIDAAMHQVAIQSPANSGQLTATGKLGADASAPSGNQNDAVSIAIPLDQR